MFFIRKQIMPKQSNKLRLLFKQIKHKEEELFELAARYHLLFVGNEAPTEKMLEHTKKLLFSTYIRLSIDLNDDLSLREKQYLSFVTKGYPSKKIAKLMKISTRTTRTYHENILKKLSSKNMIQAAFAAYKYQILDFPIYPS